MIPQKKSVLLIGFDPTLLDFSSPEFAAFPGLDAEKVLKALNADEARLKKLGCDVEMCLIDLGETAETVVRERLRRKQFDCILIGAGVRTIPSHFILFERLINLLHAHAPQAKLCFNEPRRHRGSSPALALSQPAQKGLQPMSTSSSAPRG